MYSGHFESRNIVRFANDSIGAQWILNGMNMPKFRTVHESIKALLKELDSVFIQILFLCKQQDLIGGERVYTDGVKVQASASKHKSMSYGRMVEKIPRSIEDLKKLFSELREIVEEWDSSDDDFRDATLEDASDVYEGLRKIHNDSLADRQDQIFNRDYDETPDLEGRKEALLKGLQVLENVKPENQEKATSILDKIGFRNKRLSRMEEAKSELEERWKAANGNKNIPENQQINFTDSESSIMTTKHFGVQQCYNNFAIVDAKANIILGCHTSNNPVDQISLKPCVERTKQLYGSLKGVEFGADAGFFSADNILYAEKEGIDFYASYPEADWTYAKDKFKYDEEADIYTCPGGHTLSPPDKNRGGEIREYRNESACPSCEHQKDCAKAKDGIRRIKRDMVNDKIREEGRKKADSAEGREILRLRKSVPEPVWGNIKTQDNFIQMHYRGIDEVSLEWMLHCTVQNIRKLMKVYFKSKSYQDVVHKKCGAHCELQGKYVEDKEVA
jgi:hypothetical protein